MSARANKLLASAAAVLCAIQARADDAGGFDDRITGDWRGVRASLAGRGVNLSLGYVGEWVHNVSGGERSTTAYADQIAFGADLDLERLFGWSGASFHVVVTNRNGPQLDAKAGFGTLLETHEIYGRGHYTRLTRFYLEQYLLGDRLSVKVGRSDVDFFPLSCDFINISFCGALPGYHSNGWYTWPIGQYFANVTVRPGDGFYVKAGATDVDPNNLDGDQGLRLHTRDSSQRGTLANVEAGWLPTFHDELPGSYRIGYWRNSTGYPDLEDATAMRDSSAGYYALVQQQLTSDVAGRGFTVFANFSHSDANVNKVDRLLSVGLWYTGAFAQRPRDRLGFAIGHNRVSGRLRDFGAEKPVEFNYSFAGSRGFVLMPSVQYVKDAGGRRDAGDIWIVGLKVSAQF